MNANENFEYNPSGLEAKMDILGSRRIFVRLFYLGITVAAGAAMFVSMGLAQQTSTTSQYKVLRTAKVGGDGS